MRIAAYVLAWVVLLAGCAAERPTENVPRNVQRIAKKSLLGNEYLFLKSISKVESPSPAFREYMTGMQMDGSSQIVHFVIRDKFLELYASDPIQSEKGPAEKSRILASFPIEHVDVLPKQNADGEDTHVEEETKNRRPAEEREYVLVDWTNDLIETWPDKVRRATVTENWNESSQSNASAINGWAVEKAFEDGTSIQTRYQLKRWQEAPIAGRPYPREDQLRFGFVKKTVFNKDASGRFTRSAKQDFLVRRNTSKTIRFSVSKNFPQKWRPVLRFAIRRWKEAMHDAIGDSVILIDENDDSEPGDLSKNQIYFDDSPHDDHGLLGYAPVVWDPRTMTIEKGDIYLYGRVLERALYYDPLWRKNLKAPLNEQARNDFDGNTALQSFGSSGGKLLVLPAIESSKSRFAKAAHNCSISGIDSWQPPDAGTKTTAEIETAVIGNLIFHELGHALIGLRHNFMGSVDVQHHAPGTGSSTVMDYPLSPEPITDIGVYDQEALRYAYSVDSKVRQQALMRNLLFCSDEDRISGRYGLCQAYDQGASLTEMIRRQLSRYFASFWVYHPRWDQVLFPKDPKHYDNVLMALLMPIRLAHDNAVSLITAAESHDYEMLWHIAGQRIEADGPCDKKDDRTCSEVEIRPRRDEPASGRWDGPGAPPLKRYLDQDKIRNVLNDATSAKEKAVEALREILLYSDFSDRDVTDPEDGSIVLRGLLRDKMVALTLLAVPLPNPLDQQGVVTPFSTKGKYPVAGIFGSVISNTLPVEFDSDEIKTYSPAYFDGNLRREALNLLVETLIKPGHSGEARELLEVEPIARTSTFLIPEPAPVVSTSTVDSIRRSVKNFVKEEEPLAKDWASILDIRSIVQKLFVSRYLDLALTRRLTPGTTVSVDPLLLRDLEHRRTLVRTAFTDRSRTELFMAPTALTSSGLPTATGLLIRDNINRAEDRMAGAEEALKRLENEVFEGENPSFSQLVASPQLKGRMESLSSYVGRERLFLEEIYQRLNRL
jgi:hypothetical protein